MDTFCVNPYYLRTIIDNKYSQCCWLPDTADITSIQHSLLSGQAHTDCNKCWLAESAGLTSKRQSDSKILAELTGQDMGVLQQNAATMPALSWQIKLGNDCNLRCKTCHVADSTQWYAEWNHYHPTKQVRGLNKLRTELADDVDYDLAQRIEFLGGEPFLRSAWRPFLQQLLQAGNTDLMLTFTTNGTCRPSAEDMTLLKEFSRVNINISIDGIGNRFEYLRYPAKWNEVDSNITWFQSQGFYVVSCSHTLSNMTIGYLDEFLPWVLKRFGVGKYSFNVVNAPSYFAPHVLPVGVKHSIQQRYSKSRMSRLLDPFLRLMEPGCSNYMLGRFAIELLKQDRYRDQCVADFLPEIVFFDSNRPLRKRASKVQVPLAIPLINKHTESLPTT